jgi:hypothetical protein
MNIWVLTGTYEGEQFASSHLTEKGAVLAAIQDMIEYLGVDEENLRRDSDSERPLPIYDDEMRKLPSTEVWEIFHAYGQHTWEGMDYSVEILKTQVQA